VKTIAVFNNKGGVGKTTLTYHLGHILAEMGFKTLIIDLDPQCNLTIYGIETEVLHDIWAQEDGFIDDFEAKQKSSKKEYRSLIKEIRSVHFLLKPAEAGGADFAELPPPCELRPRLHLIPGRLTMHMYEDRISTRWSEVYRGDPLAIKTVTRIRWLAEEYAKAYGYDYVIMDTSPSLGILNKAIISTTDCFMIPCVPDMFSLYGIRNIGKALTEWKKEFDTIYHLLSRDKRKNFPDNFVQFVGYSIYNAKKYANVNKWDLARASFNFATQIPDTIRKYISSELRSHLSDELWREPIGGTAIMHSHSTLPNMAQKYHTPIWDLPRQRHLEDTDKATISLNRSSYEDTKEKYELFADDLVNRIELLDILG
jgi:cellulose biosynthesis protein BcsQ